LAQIQLRLATYIDGDVEREEFLRSSMGHPAATQEISSISARTGAQQDGPGQSAAAILSPELLRQVEVSLTRSIGPIARVLVRRELSKSTSAADFFTELANCIPDERDRMAFLNMRPMG